MVVCVYYRLHFICIQLCTAGHLINSFSLSNVTRETHGDGDKWTKRGRRQTRSATKVVVHEDEDLVIRRKIIWVLNPAQRLRIEGREHKFLVILIKWKF